MAAEIRKSAVFFFDSKQIFYLPNNFDARGNATRNQNKPEKNF